MAGVTAFRQAYLSAGLDQQADFNSYEARAGRYKLFWAMFENTAYDRVHAWVTSFKAEYGLYRHIRSIYNPVARIANFWQTHLWGGELDPEAGDGKTIPTALPIITDNDGIREGVAQLWQDSSFEAVKDVITLWGTLLGDVFVRDVDDPDDGRVYFEMLHPGLIVDKETDRLGNLIYYALEEQRDDPRGKDQQVTYREEARVIEAEGEDEGDKQDVVEYRTYLDDEPYPWNGEAATWTVPYPFIPMVHIVHDYVGLPWGWSEVHNEIAKIREIDDQASILSDQIRKTLNAPWFFSGAKKTDVVVSLSGQTPTSDAPYPGREEIPALYGPTGSDAKPLVAQLDIEATLKHIEMMLREMERDFPELQTDLWRAMNDVSGRALRLARQGAETKVIQRRPHYDAKLVRLQKMALAIGGIRQYEGYESFSLDDFEAGNLDHSIGKRPVFTRDPFDDIELGTALWKEAQEAGAAGVPLPVFLEMKGWDEDKIAAIVQSDEYQNKQRLIAMSLMGPRFSLPPGRNDDGEDQ